MITSKAYYIIVLRYTNMRAYNAISHLITTARQILIDASWEIRIVVFRAFSSIIVCYKTLPSFLRCILLRQDIINFSK